MPPKLQQQVNTPPRERVGNPAEFSVGHAMSGMLKVSATKSVATKVTARSIETTSTVSCALYEQRKTAESCERACQRWDGERKGRSYQLTFFICSTFSAHILYRTEAYFVHALPSRISMPKFQNI